MSIKLSQVAGDLEIDVDIEKKITQLQEAKLAGEIERPKQLSIDPEKQLTEWHLEKGLKTFLANVEFEKEDLSKKIEEEDAKIKALEELFGGLTKRKEDELNNAQAISETVFNELSEDEKKEREKIRLKDVFNQTRVITVDKIQNTVSNFYNISLNEMLSQRRSRPLARPRQIAMYLAKKMTTRSLPEIGRRFSNRDHTTVIHAVKTITKLSEKDEEIKNNLNQLKAILLED